MEKEWITLAELQRVSNLVTEKEYIDETKKMWENIFREYKIDYKFDIVVDTEYSIQGVRTKGQLKKVYILKVYTTKESFPQAKSIINQYMAQEIGPEENEIEENNYEPKEERFAKYFFVIVLLIAIILEIGLIISAKNEESGIGKYIVISVFIVIEVYAIIRILKK